MQSRRQQQGQELGMATRAVRGGLRPEDNQWQTLVTPVLTSVVNRQVDIPSQRLPSNTLLGNPTRESVERRLAELENCKGAIVVPSGMLAIQTITQLLKSGDQILISDGYLRTQRLMKEVIQRNGITVDLVDMTNLREVEGAIKPTTRLILIETPTNPMLRLVDIQAIVKLARKKQKGDSLTQRILVAVDNTILTPVLQRPLELGADMSVVGLTKYMNGHGDAVMGSISTNDEEIERRLRELQQLIGLIPSPLECMLVERGLKTLPLRMERIQRSALDIAQTLEKNPNVERVIHPGLKSNPQNELALRQSDGHSGLLSIIIKGNVEQAKRVLKNLRLIIQADFIGGTETTACIPALASNAAQTQEERTRMGLVDNLIQISIGLENPEDLLADLEQALGK